MIQQLKNKMRALANPERAEVSLRYFKTGPGEYGYGDRFIGNTVPDLRKLAKEYRELPIHQTLKLLHSEFHEERVVALLILNDKFLRGDRIERKKINSLYLKNTKWINNWDLVDCSAPIIVGEYIPESDPNLLKKLARSKNLWERRIAMLATFAEIKKGQVENALQIAELLLHDKEDLIHKASGWMLREAGKKQRRQLEAFLEEHAAKMPRTMLRYAIEKLDEPKRRYYMQLAGNSRLKSVK